MGDEYEAGNVSLRLSGKKTKMTLEKIKEMNLIAGEPIETTIKTTERFVITYNNYPGYFAYTTDTKFAYARQSQNGFLMNIQLKELSEIEKIVRFERKVEKEGEK